MSQDCRSNASLLPKQAPFQPWAGLARAQGGVWLFATNIACFFLFDVSGKIYIPALWTGLGQALDKGEGLVMRGGFWRSPYGGLNVGDSRTSSERVVALLIAHRTVSPDF